MAIRIIIVGAGIGGLTAAVALRQAGCEVTVGSIVSHNSLFFCASRSFHNSVLGQPELL